ncbi:MAG TPA: aminoacyl-tRNA hydrolase [Steroidobacteraceae bacterium]|nr:aminoacyl-tRNA hydrolase [Steroidobacteraceae bacterium]
MAGTALKLIVGLGNPGPDYARTRHNAGWWFVDALARHHGGTWKADARQHTELARVRLGAHELWLLKPTAFMNCSGAPVAAVANFYRIPVSEILVVHDELDLPPGTVRLKQGGGHGGHNGLRDLLATLEPDFWRLRLGIGHPGHRDQVVNFVLQRASAKEEALIEAAIDAGLAAVPEFLEAGAQRAMNRLHERKEDKEP